MASLQCSSGISGTFQCTGCLFTFDLREHFLDHLNRASSDDLHRCAHLRCFCCGYEFNGAQSLLQHINKATETDEAKPSAEWRKILPRRHRCTFCTKSFQRPMDLTRHMRTHTGEKPYECPMCGNRFKLKATLNDHLKTHSKAEADIHCSVCSKIFLSRSALKLHMRLHTNETPFACPVKECGKAFRTKKLLSSHLRQRDAHLAETAEAPAHKVLNIESLSEVLCINGKNLSLTASENSAFHIVKPIKHGEKTNESGLPPISTERQISIRVFLRRGSVVPNIVGTSSALSRDILIDTLTLHNLSVDGYIVSVPLERTGLPAALRLLIEPNAVLSRLCSHANTHFSTVICPTSQTYGLTGQPMSIVISKEELLQNTTHALLPCRVLLRTSEYGPKPAVSGAVLSANDRSHKWPMGNVYAD